MDKETGEVLFNVEKNNRTYIIPESLYGWLSN
jgi:hypothetical protein